MLNELDCVEANVWLDKDYSEPITGIVREVSIAGKGFLKIQPGGSGCDGGLCLYYPIDRIVMIQSPPMSLEF